MIMSELIISQSPDADATESLGLVCYSLHLIALAMLPWQELEDRSRYFTSVYAALIIIS